MGRGSRRHIEVAKAIFEEEMEGVVLKKGGRAVAWRSILLVGDANLASGIKMSISKYDEQ